jgi:hypothetical protein
MRRITVLVGAALVSAGLVLGGSGAGAQQQEEGAERELVVAKVVEGTAPSGFVVEVDCEGFGERPAQSWDLPFLADGSPDPDAPAAVQDDWDIVDGAWRYGTEDLSPHACTAIETEDAGADSVTYECEYEPAAVEGDDFPGDPCEDTVEDEQAAVNMPFGPFGDTAGICFETGPPWPEECVDRAVLTVTNTFVEPTTTTTTTVPPTTTTTAPAPTPEPAPAPAAAPVRAEPRFTG